MTKWNKEKTKGIDLAQLERFIQTPARADRMQMIRSWRNSQRALPFSVTRDLFALKLAPQELSSLLEATIPESSREFEFWVFENLLKWPQDLAATAIRTWAARTERLLWHRLIPILRIPGLPQRLHYCILDIAPWCGGVEITSTALQASGWEDYSPAYHGLIFDRAIQFNLKSKRLDDLALQTITKAQMNTHPDDKSLHSAAGWLLRHGETKSLQKILHAGPDAAWKHFMTAAIQRNDDRKRDIDRVAKSLLKDTVNLSKVLEEWPAPWSRQEVSADVINGLITVAVRDRYEDIAGLVAGCASQMIVQALSQLDAKISSVVSMQFRSLIPFTDGLALEQKILAQGIEENDRKNWIECCLQTDLAGERADMLSLNGSMGAVRLRGFGDLPQNGVTEVAHFNMGTMAPFFDAIAGRKPEIQSNEFWSLMARGWTTSDKADLTALSTQSRKQKGIATIAYLMTLGRFKGVDEAVLKMLDHIRTPEEDELRAIVSSLGEVDTIRSLQELVAAITRPNCTTSIQQDIVAILKKKDVSALQQELRATVQDLKIPNDPASPLTELRDALTSMLQTQEPNVTRIKTLSAATGSIDDKKLDDELQGMIPHYRELSSEVRRALRTALFFNHSIQGSEATHAIDLSPLIDMQYKAMELLFREFFEDSASQALQRGAIPRKLDVIGYARPIPQKMDEFENYIASMPIVREIPFFSKFKLRKMLRAICQFEPGRRFTLDGLKAFGLFFLCFSRKDCRFGLAGLFPIGTKDDRELAEFAKELHVFQDFRNRAAHEGFHPEASNDIQGIWRTTALIVQWAFRIRAVLQANSAANKIEARAS